jgi:hypothetical protein
MNRNSGGAGLAGAGDFRMADPLQIYLGIKTANVVAGLAGGAVRAILRPRVGAVWTMVTGFAGAMAAAYLTPLVIALASHWGYLPADASTAMDLERAVSFVVGLTGMSVCEGIVLAGQRWGKNPVLRVGVPRENSYGMAPDTYGMGGAAETPIGEAETPLAAAPEVAGE